MKSLDTRMIFVTGESEKTKQNFLAECIIFLGSICIPLYADTGRQLWNSKDLNIGGTGITRINFVNINNTHRFIDTLKYYQESLSQLTKTATEAIKKLTTQCIANHDYFGTV